MHRSFEILVPKSFKNNESTLKNRNYSIFRYLCPSLHKEEIQEEIKLNIFRRNVFERGGIYLRGERCI